MRVMSSVCLMVAVSIAASSRARDSWPPEGYARTAVVFAGPPAHLCTTTAFDPTGRHSCKTGQEERQVLYVEELSRKILEPLATVSQLGVFVSCEERERDEWSLSLRLVRASIALGVVSICQLKPRAIRPATLLVARLVCSRPCYPYLCVDSTFMFTMLRLRHRLRSPCLRRLLNGIIGSSRICTMRGCASSNTRYRWVANSRGFSAPART